MRFRDDDPLLTRLRTLCLALPEAKEKVSHGLPNFYTVKVFAQFGAVVKGDHDADDVAQSLVVLPDENERRSLLQDTRFFVPAYLGAYGWIGLNLRRAHRTGPRSPSWSTCPTASPHPRSSSALLDAGR